MTDVQCTMYTSEWLRCGFIVYTWLNKRKLPSHMCRKRPRKHLQVLRMGGTIMIAYMHLEALHMKNDTDVQFEALNTNNDIEVLA